MITNINNFKKMLENLDANTNVPVFDFVNYINQEIEEYNLDINDEMEINNHFMSLNLLLTKDKIDLRDASLLTSYLNDNEVFDENFVEEHFDLFDNEGNVIIKVNDSNSFKVRIEWEYDEDGEYFEETPHTYLIETNELE